MSPAAPTTPYDEQATLNELAFALGGRDEPTVALVECASLAKRQELEAELARRMPEYQFYQLDVTPIPVTSLLGTLNAHLPAEVRDSKPVSWVVNVHGLENSRQLNPEGQLVPSPLTAQLNLERELLFRRVPYLIVLWGDADFFLTLQREAPDFWHWVTYRFRFEDHTARPVAALPPLPPERLPGPGNVAERQARIAELRERYDHLALDDSDKKRLLKDKIDILTLLGAEYKEAFLYTEAAEAYQIAIALQERMRADTEEQGYLWFELGRVYEKSKRFTESLAAYERCKSLSSDENMASIFHQIGVVYYGQREWELSLANYHQALRLQRLTNDFQQANTLHQIGMLYEAQQEWSLALNNYRQALESRERIGDMVNSGSTYHQIGITYWYQHKWTQALKNFHQAIDWKQKASDEYSTGITSQLIGRVYIIQKRYGEAITWLKRSVDCLSKYGHPNTNDAQNVLNYIIKLQKIIKHRKAIIKRKQKSIRKKKLKIIATTRKIAN